MSVLKVGDTVVHDRTRVVVRAWICLGLEGLLTDLHVHCADIPAPVSYRCKRRAGENAGRPVRTRRTDENTARPKGGALPSPQGLGRSPPAECMVRTSDTGCTSPQPAGVHKAGEGKIKQIV